MEVPAKTAFASTTCLPATACATQDGPVPIAILTSTNVPATLAPMEDNASMESEATSKLGAVS